MGIYETGIYEDRYKEGLILQNRGPGSAFGVVLCSFKG